MATLRPLGIPAILLGLGLTPGHWTDRTQLPSPLRIDRTEYVATPAEGEAQARRYGFTLIARYENRTRGVLYLARCNPRDSSPIYGIEPVDSTQESAYDEAWACVGHDYPITVAPGAIRVDTLRIAGPNASDYKTNAPLGILEGEFRLMYQVGTCTRQGSALCLLPLAARRSSAFRVRLAR
jgi:hypothetical protein